MAQHFVPPGKFALFMFPLATITSKSALALCLIVFSITVMYPNAANGVGARKQTCLLRRRRSKTT